MRKAIASRMSAAVPWIWDFEGERMRWLQDQSLTSGNAIVKCLFFSRTTPGEDLTGIETGDQR